jgi:hypothetical protein
MIRINLAPEQKRRRGVPFRLSLPSFNLGLLFGALYLLAVVGIGAYWWSLSSEETTLAGDVDRKSKELATLKTTIGQGNKVKDLVAELRQRVDVVKQLTKNQARPILLVDVFASAIPRPVGHRARGAQLGAARERHRLLDDGRLRFHGEPALVREVSGRGHHRLPPGPGPAQSTGDLRGHLPFRGLTWRSRPSSTRSSTRRSRRSSSPARSASP